VKDAIVRIEGVNQSVITDKNGRFTFENVSLVGKRIGANSHLSIIASKGGASKILVNNYGEEYVMRLRNATNQNIATKESVTEIVTVNSNQSLLANVTLSESDVTLDEVVVTSAKRSGKKKKEAKLKENVLTFSGWSCSIFRL